MALGFGMVGCGGVWDFHPQLLADKALADDFEQDAVAPAFCEFFSKALLDDFQQDAVAQAFCEFLSPISYIHLFRKTCEDYLREGFLLLALRISLLDALVSLRELAVLETKTWLQAVNWYSMRRLARGCSDNTYIRSQFGGGAAVLLRTREPLQASYAVLEWFKLSLSNEEDGDGKTQHCGCANPTAGLLFDSPGLGAAGA